MLNIYQYLNSSLGLKLLMAITGLILTSFVLFHMLGNLLIYLGPDVYNSYAHKLHSIPSPLMLLIRLFLFFATLVHILVAIKLTLANRKAKSASFQSNSVIASYASKTMRFSGLILLSFMIFHILHYTTRTIPGMEYNDNDVFLKKSALISNEDKGISNYVNLYSGGYEVVKNNQNIKTFNVYDMLILGFKNLWVSLFYVLSTGLLCLHLSHGINSSFQTLGLSNKLWRPRFEIAGKLYGWTVFLGFASIPLFVQLGILNLSNTIL